MRTWTVPIADERWFKARAQVSARSGLYPVAMLVAVQLEEPPGGDAVAVEEVDRRTAAAELPLGYGHADRVAEAVERDEALTLEAQDAEGQRRTFTISATRISVETPHPDYPVLELTLAPDEASLVAEALRAATAHRRYLDEADLSWEEEVDELLAEFGNRPSADEAALERVRARWPSLPDEYLDVLRRKNGGEGSLTETYLVLRPAEELEEENDDLADAEHLRDVVVVGGNGGGEAIGYDVAGRVWVMAPFIGGREDFIVLGETFLEALRKADSRPFD